MSKILLIFLLLLSNLVAKGQFCTGSTSEPKKVDFDRGTDNFGEPIYDNSPYTYIAGFPYYAGAYTIAKTTNGLNGGAYSGISNNTPNDPEGYMLLVTPKVAPGVFYQKNFENLCPNSQYEFSVYVNSIDGKTNLNFTLETNSIIVKEFKTDEIPSSSIYKWIKYAVVFTSPPNVDTEDLVLKISTLNTGGLGNFFAIDDINLITCGPLLTSKIINPTLSDPNNTGICEGENITYTLKAEVAPGFINYRAIWQQNIGNGWEDIPDAFNPNYTVTFSNATKGKYQYRFSASEEEKFNSMGCRIVSVPIVINVSAKPMPVASNSGTQCVGKNIQLYASEGDSFLWIGPNGFSSTLKNPILSNVTLADAGVYTVTGFVNNCKNSAQTTVQVVESVIASTNISTAQICETTSVQLEANGGTTYSWTPIDGLSDPNISNPIATPKTTTTYTVKATSGTCFDTKTITIDVIENTITDAGEDQKILAGESVTLNGKATGTDLDLKYLWSPIDFLDDPTKLNPIATPPKDITYILTTSSLFGCTTSSDEVFINVLPKIIIPNSFSPNGDGINDTWNISIAKTYPNTRLKIMNRYGKLVHQSTGYFKPWDGKLNGKDLPSASYYYTVYFGTDDQIFTGWIFLIR